MRSFANGSVTASATSMQLLANTMKKREVTRYPRHTREATGKLIFWVRRVYAMADRIDLLAGWDGPPRRARGKLSKRTTRIREWFLKGNGSRVIR